MEQTQELRRRFADGEDPILRNSQLDTDVLLQDLARIKVYEPPWFLTLPETNIATENWWLENEISFCDGLFSGAMIVTGSIIGPDFLGGGIQLVPFSASRHPQKFPGE